jgi:hypothetical protein
MLIQGLVGAPAAATAGTTPTVRVGQLGDMIISELHGRFYEQTYRGNVYQTGHIAPIALSANTITTSATTTPIIGVWNPLSSGVNLVILQASLQNIINTVTTPVGPGAFVWAISNGNTAISTGLLPINTRTLQPTGSQAKAFAGATALTGLTNVLTIVAAATIPTLGNITYGTIAATATSPSVGGVQNFDGSLIIPPGSVLSLLNTTSTTTVSVFGSLLWEEVAV